MMCKACRLYIEDDALHDEVTQTCESCFNAKATSEYAEEIIPFLLRHEINFKREDFGNGEGFYLDLGKGMIINFHNSGGIVFEYDKELDTSSEKETQE